MESTLYVIYYQHLTERRAPKRNFYRRIRRKVSVNQFWRRSVSLCLGGNISGADNSANSEWQDWLAHYHFSLDCPNMFPWNQILQNLINLTNFATIFPFILLNSIILQCSISILPENVRKAEVFWRFQGV